MQPQRSAPPLLALPVRLAPPGSPTKAGRNQRTKESMPG